MRWDASGVAATALGHLGTSKNDPYGAPDGITQGQAFAINSAGTAVGNSDVYDDSGQILRLGAPVRWDPSGKATELGTLGGYATVHSSPAALNDAGTAVGSADKYTDRGARDERAVRWDASGTAAIELGNLGIDIYGFATSFPWAVNGSGTVVGEAEYVNAASMPEGDHAVYWGTDTKAVDLNTLIDPNSGWDLRVALEISNTGWIVGEGLFDPDGLGGQDAYSRTFLIQVPATVAPGRTWVGPSSGGNWATAANWSPAIVPTATDSVAIAGSSIILSANTTVGQLSLSGGASLTLAAAGNRVLRASGLSIATGLKLNLNDNTLIVDYAGNAGGSTMNSIVALLVAGRAGGASPAGIYSPAANASAGTRALGVAQASDVLGLSGAQTALFAGQSVDATAILVKYTLAADANLDGQVGFADLVRVAHNYGTTGKLFADGDFNYDGNVDFADLVILAQQYNTALPTPAAATMAPASTPAVAATSAIRRDRPVAKPIFSVMPVVKPAAVKPRATLRQQRR